MPHRQAERKARTRQLLLEVAEEIFLERGYHAATLDDIASRAGMTKGAFYSNFESKDDLLCALLEDRLEQRVELVAAAIDPTGSLEEQALSAAQQFHQVFEEDRRWLLLALTFAVVSADNEHLARRYAERYGTIKESMTAVVDARAAEAGVELRYEPAEVVTLAFALANGLSLERLRDPDGIRPGLMGDAFAALLLPPA